MNKLILADKTEIELKQGGGLSNLQVELSTAQEFTDTISKLTPDNLSSVQTKYGDNIVGTYTDLVLNPGTYDMKDGKFLLVICLREMTEIERLQKKIAELEASQEVQNKAILETATKVSVQTTTDGGDK